MRGNSLGGSLVLLCLVLSPAAYFHRSGRAQARKEPQAAAGARSEDADAAQLRSALGAASLRLESGKSGLRTVFVRRLGSQQSVVGGVNDSEVTRVLAEGKETLLQGLDRPNLDGIKAHVERFYPRPELDVVAFDTVRQGSSVELITVVSEESVVRAFAATETYLNKIAAAAVRPTVDLEVTSTERLATCKLFAGLRLKREVTTDDVTRNLARGLYKYTVTKEGYRPAEGDLNLVDDDVTVLECTMHRVTDDNGPSKCRHR